MAVSRWLAQNPLNVQVRRRALLAGRSPVHSVLTVLARGFRINVMFLRMSICLPVRSVSLFRTGILSYLAATLPDKLLFFKTQINADGVFWKYQAKGNDPMNFASDNVYGVDEAVMAALVAANEGTAASYGADEITARVEMRFNEIFERDVKVFLVATGTAANALALSAVCPAYGAIFAHSHAHVMIDECGAPEMFTGGAKMVGLAGIGGKITPAMVEAALAGFIRGEHDPKPAAISITQASELGTVYSLEEVAAFGDVARNRGLRLHMDGARFGNAVASLSCSPADLTWRAGVDVLSFGATKNGAMGVEAVVFFDDRLAEDFCYRRMRSGQLLSKSRYLAAQMEAYLEGGRWLDNARRANQLAARLADGLCRIKGMRPGVERQANEVFVIMAKDDCARLAAGGAVFHEWLASGRDTSPVGEGEVMIRLVTSFLTPPEDIEAFVRLAAGA